MTLEGLRDHFVKQVDAYKAYFRSDSDDAKTAKSYRKSIKEAEDRLAVVEKILLDGYTPMQHSGAVTNDNPGD